MIVRPIPIEITPGNDTNIRISADVTYIGATGDHKVQEFVFDRPTEYGDADLILIFGGFERQHIGSKSTYLIPNALTQSEESPLQIAFEQNGMEIAHSNTLHFRRTKSQEGEGAPIEPLPDPERELRARSFARVTAEGNTLGFYNVDGQLVDTAEVAGGGSGEGSAIAWLPNVDADSNISWTRSSATTPPTTRNIRGLPGNDGADGKDFDPADVQRIDALESSVKATQADVESSAERITVLESRPVGASNVIVSATRPENPSEGMVWYDMNAFGSLMPLSALPMGAVVETDFLWQGIPITFNIVAKNYPGYPANSATLLSEKGLIERVYDAPEPTNPETARQTSGNNRYSVSNIRQWLNSSEGAGNWYSPQHAFDAPPAYANEAGFLFEFPQAFREKLLATAIDANTANVDGAIPDSMTDKVFLATYNEIIAWGLTTNTLRIKYNRAGTARPWWNRNANATSPTNGEYTTSGGVANSYYGVSGALACVPVVNIPADSYIRQESGKNVLVSELVVRQYIYWGGQWWRVDPWDAISTLAGG